MPVSVGQELITKRRRGCFGCAGGTEKRKRKRETLFDGKILGFHFIYKGKDGNDMGKAEVVSDLLIIFSTSSLPCYQLCEEGKIKQFKE